MAHVLTVSSAHGGHKYTWKLIAPQQSDKQTKLVLTAEDFVAVEVEFVHKGSDVWMVLEEGGDWKQNEGSLQVLIDRVFGPYMSKDPEVMKQCSEDVAFFTAVAISLLPTIEKAITGVRSTCLGGR